MAGLINSLAIDHTLAAEARNCGYEIRFHISGNKSLFQKVSKFPSNLKEPCKKGLYENTRKLCLTEWSPFSEGAFETLQASH